MRRFTAFFLLAFAIMIGANQAFAAQAGGPNDTGKQERPERDDGTDDESSDDPFIPRNRRNIAGFPGAVNIDRFAEQIDQMMNNNMLFLALQTKVQNISQVTQLTSNILKSDHEAKLNAIRNMR